MGRGNSCWVICLFVCLFYSSNGWSFLFHLFSLVSLVGKVFSFKNYYLPNIYRGRVDCCSSCWWWWFVCLFVCFCFLFLCFFVCLFVCLFFCFCFFLCCLWQQFFNSFFFFTPQDGEGFFFFFSFFKIYTSMPPSRISNDAPLTALNMLNSHT